MIDETPFFPYLSHAMLYYQVFDSRGVTEKGILSVFNEKIVKTSELVLFFLALSLRDLIRVN